MSVAKYPRRILNILLNLKGDKSMATYVLVHGGDRDGSIWDGVAGLLREHGHQVFCPTMTSIKKTTLQHNINEIGDLVQTNQLNKIILVGHSYGAMVITGVLDKWSDAISCLVYIDSAIPQNGESLYGMLADEGFNYKDFGLTPDKPCLEVLYFNEDILNSKPKAYIHCLKSEFIQASKPIYENLIAHAKQKNWIYFNLDTAHSCMLTQPKELSIILCDMQILLQSK
jgi:pimeloyl-ACP methyl ester carboxylesterase